MKSLRVALGVLLVSAAATAAPAQVRVCVSGSTDGNFGLGLKTFQRVSSEIAQLQLPDGTALQSSIITDSKNKAELTQRIQENGCEYVFSLEGISIYDPIHKDALGFAVGTDGTVRPNYQPRQTENVAYHLKRVGQRKSLLSGTYSFDDKKFITAIAADKARAQTP